MGLATVNSSYIVAERGQDLTNTVTLATSQSIVGWDVSANLYPYAGGPILATGTATATDTDDGVWSIAWSGEDLDLQGSYVWDFWRTDTGFQTPIVDVSAFLIRQSGGLGGPTLTNFSEYMGFLGMSGLNIAVNDAFLRQSLQLIAAAERAITNAIGRVLTYDADLVEYYDSWPQGGLQLRRRPAWCVNEVCFQWNGNYGSAEDAFGEDTAISEFSYGLKRDSIWNDNGSYSGILVANWWNGSNNSVPAWALGWANQGSFGGGWNRPYANLASGPTVLPGCLKITYSAGYQLIPEDIKLAVFQVVRQRLNAAKRGVAFQSESGEGYSYSLGPYAAEELMIGSVSMTINSYRGVEMLLG